MFKKLEAPENEIDITKNWKFTDRVYVSFVCITFNQCKYIRDTLNSFLAQNTEYRFEIIIHDDASNDSTHEILYEYKEKYPNIIRLIIQSENQYSQGKKITPIACSIAEGDYIALCEGDDYWIKPSKIQSQIETLNASENISLIHTKCYKETVSTGEWSESNVPQEDNSFENLLIRNGIQTPSTMFRKIDYENYNLIFGKSSLNWKFGDLPLWLYLSTIGKVVLMNDNCVLYRVLTESASNSTNPERVREFIKTGLDIRIFMIKYYLDKIGSSEDLKRGINHLANKHILAVIENDYAIESRLIKYANRSSKSLLYLYQLLPTRLIAKNILKLAYKTNWGRF